jgi:hypothetical protein
MVKKPSSEDEEDDRESESESFMLAMVVRQKKLSTPKVDDSSFPLAPALLGAGTDDGEAMRGVILAMSLN